MRDELGWVQRSLQGAAAYKDICQVQFPCQKQAISVGCDSNFLCLYMIFVCFME